MSQCCGCTTHQITFFAPPCISNFHLFVLGRCCFLLTFPSCSLCFSDFTVRSFLLASVGLPHLFLPLPSHCYSLLFVIHSQLCLMCCRNVAFTAVCQQNDHSSRNHWQVRLIRTASHQITRSSESPESQHQGRFSPADCHTIWVRCLSHSWVTVLNLALSSQGKVQVLMSAFPVNDKDWTIVGPLRSHQRENMEKPLSSFLSPCFFLLSSNPIKRTQPTMRWSATQHFLTSLPRLWHSALSLLVSTEDETCKKQSQIYGFIFNKKRLINFLKQLDTVVFRKHYSIRRK